MDAATKIIVVDDETRICRNVEKILSKSNFEVTSAASAAEAMEMMAKNSYSMLISDIVMPGMNGLELLKLVKKEWPLTKAVMMTAYASTDTAVKAIRMGALDYIPKPFTPDELRTIVDKTLSGKLVEAIVPEKEKEAIDIIDVDVPFDREEITKYTGDDYAARLTRSDIPEARIVPPSELENYCELGDMVCDIFKKLGNTCKGGTKTNACPQKKAKKKKGKAKAKGFDAKKLIGIDQPFDYKEVVSITGPEYVQYLDRDGFAFLPYDELAKNVLQEPAKGKTAIDVDMPFDLDEVAKYTDDDYAARLTRSDIPEARIVPPSELENYCELGDMVCDIFKKLGNTCKGGTKTNACPQKKAKKKKGLAKAKGFDAKKLIGIDQPFDYREVAAITGPEYINNLVHEDLSVLPYEELKKSVALKMEEKEHKVIDFPDLHAEPDMKNILVIDDEVAVNNNIRKILSKEGYHVDQAVTKAEALERINSHPYKLVLLDLRIPKVKGLELLSAIAEIQPKARVIIITGYASIETAVEAARIGAIDYLPKPFTPDEIRNATEQAFRYAA